MPAPMLLAHLGSQSGLPDAAMREQAHLLWDRLADFDAADVDAALDFLLRGLCRIAVAQDACWIGAVPKPTSPETVDDRVAACGRSCDCRPRAGQSESCGKYCRGGDHGHVIHVRLSVDEARESCFRIFRDTAQPPFSAHERGAVTYALRGIRRFHRHLMLCHGLVIAESPLTPVERSVLKCLLGGLPEKQIAAELGQNFHTTHEYVRSIYRKFDVNNRASLMALWLGKRV